MTPKQERRLIQLCYVIVKELFLNRPTAESIKTLITAKLGLQFPGNTKIKDHLLNTICDYTLRGGIDTLYGGLDICVDLTKAYPTLTVDDVFKESWELDKLVTIVEDQCDDDQFGATFFILRSLQRAKLKQTRPFADVLEQYKTEIIRALLRHIKNPDDAYGSAYDAEYLLEDAVTALPYYVNWIEVSTLAKYVE